MEIYISERVAKKLAQKHNVAEDEVMQCFTSTRGFTLETREQHQIEGALIYWFISKTVVGRRLKVVFAHNALDDEAQIMTAYEPSEIEESLWADKTNPKMK